MTVEPDKTLSGTDPQDQPGGNAAATPTAGTAGDPGSGGNGDEVERLRAENDRLTKAHQQSLAEKSRKEELERENEQLRANARVVDPDQEAYRQAYARYAALKEQADRGEPYAQAVLEQAQMLAEIKRKQMEDRQLAAIPQEKRDEVDKIYQQGGYQSPAKVWELMKPGWEAQSKAAEAEAERQKAAAAALGGRVDTRTRTVGAAEAKRKKMTFAAYEELQAAAESDASKRPAAEQAFKDKEAGVLDLEIG